MTHPDYPALTAVTDFLSAGNMDYQVVEANASYIHEFNYPLLAHIQLQGQQYMHLVNDAVAWDREKEITQHWTGIVLFHQKKAQWHNEQNILYERNKLKNKITAIAWAVAGALLFTISVTQYFSPVVNFFGLLSFTGLALSLFALGTELGFQIRLVKQVCGVKMWGIRADVQKYLKAAMPMAYYLNHSCECIRVYFASQFIIYLWACLHPDLFPCIFIISFRGIAVAAWSIYTQAALTETVVYTMPEHSRWC